MIATNGCQFGLEGCLAFDREGNADELARLLAVDAFATAGQRAVAIAHHAQEGSGDGPLTKRSTRSPSEVNERRLWSSLLGAAVPPPKEALPVITRASSHNPCRRNSVSNWDPPSTRRDATPLRASSFRAAW